MLLGYRVIEGALNILNPKVERKLFSKASKFEWRIYKFLWKLFWVFIVLGVLAVSFGLSYGKWLLAAAFTTAIARQSLRSYMNIKYGFTADSAGRFIESLFKRQVNKTLLYVLIAVVAFVVVFLVILGYVGVIGFLLR